MEDEQSAEQPFITGRMHKSRHYFYCPHCALSFRHPPSHYYLVGYGYCWYCLRYVPIEGGDAKGIIKINEAAGATRSCTIRTRWR